MMGDDADAVELKPNQTITGQDPPAPEKPKNVREPSKSRTPPKQKPADASLPSKDKPLWVDEPKPVPKHPKEKELPPTKMADEAPVAAGLKNKKSKKKSVATQTSAPEPSSPKSEDFIVKLK